MVLDEEPIARSDRNRVGWRLGHLDPGSLGVLFVSGCEDDQLRSGSQGQQHGAGAHDRAIATRSASSSNLSAASVFSAATLADALASAGPSFPRPACGGNSAVARPAGRAALAILTVSVAATAFAAALSAHSAAQARASTISGPPRGCRCRLARLLVQAECLLPAA